MRPVYVEINEGAMVVTRKGYWQWQPRYPWDDRLQVALRLASGTD